MPIFEIVFSRPLPIALTIPASAEATVGRSPFETGMPAVVDELRRPTRT